MTLEKKQLDRIEGKVDKLYDLTWNHKIIAEQRFATKVEVRWALGLIITAGVSLGFMIV